jgi:hypothetical protein
MRRAREQARSNGASEEPAARPICGFRHAPKLRLKVIEEPLTFPIAAQLRAIRKRPVDIAARDAGKRARRKLPRCAPIRCERNVSRD